MNFAQNMKGGVPDLLDNIFGFLRRKTDFYSPGNEQSAKDLVDKAFEKHKALAVEKYKQKIEEEEKKNDELKKRKKRKRKRNKNKRNRMWRKLLMMIRMWL